MTRLVRLVVAAMLLSACSGGTGAAKPSPTEDSEEALATKMCVKARQLVADLDAAMTAWSKGALSDDDLSQRLGDQQEQALVAAGGTTSDLSTDLDAFADALGAFGKAVFLRDVKSIEPTKAQMRAAAQKVDADCTAVPGAAS